MSFYQIIKKIFQINTFSVTFFSSELRNSTYSRYDFSKCRFLRNFFNRIKKWLSIVHFHRANTTVLCPEEIFQLPNTYLDSLNNHIYIQSSLSAKRIINSSRRIDLYSRSPRRDFDYYIYNTYLDEAARVRAPHVSEALCALCPRRTFKSYRSCMRARTTWTWQSAPRWSVTSRAP